jgi:hypothetical protein
MALPTSDYYQQIKDLEGKSEVERRQLVYKALVKRGDAAWIVPLLAAVAVTALWVVIGMAVARVATIASRGGPAAPAATNPANPTASAGGNSAPAGVIVVTTPPAAPPPAILRPLRTLVWGLGLIVFLAAFVTTRRMLVVRTIRRLLNRTGCPFCEFNLIGLRPQGTYITCPECGERFDLLQHGMKPDDLIAPGQGRKFEGAGRFGAYQTPPGAAKAEARGTRRAGGVKRMGGR